MPIELITPTNNCPLSLPNASRSAASTDGSGFGSRPKRAMCEYFSSANKPASTGTASLPPITARRRQATMRSCCGESACWASTSSLATSSLLAWGWVGFCACSAGAASAKAAAAANNDRRIFFMTRPRMD